MPRESPNQHGPSEQKRSVVLGVFHSQGATTNKALNHVHVSLVSCCRSHRKIFADLKLRPGRLIKVVMFQIFCLHAMYPSFLAIWTALVVFLQAAVVFEGSKKLFCHTSILHQTWWFFCIIHPGKRTGGTVIFLSTPMREWVELVEWHNFILNGLMRSSSNGSVALLITSGATLTSYPKSCPPSTIKCIKHC